MVRLILGIFAVIGLGLLIGGVFSIQHTRRFLQTAASAPGVVTENVRRGHRSGYYPRVLFRTATGQKISFVGNVGTRPPSYRVNEPVIVLYDPLEPYRASIRSFGGLWVTSAILCGLGLLFCLPGVVAAAVRGMRARTKAWLEQNGLRVQAEFTRVALNRSVRVNGANPYRIVCQWLDPTRNQIHVFNSGNIWFDPTSYIPGKTLEVLIDPNNPHRYLVNTSFLPKSA